MDINVFFIVIIIGIYFLFGLFTDMMINLYFNYENPLWKLVTVVFWPFAKLYLLGYLVAEWILSVIEYYKEKKK